MTGCTSTPSDLADQKKRMRAQALEQRDRLSAAASGASLDRDAAGHVAKRLEKEFGDAGRSVILAGYMPMRGELCPLPAMQAHPGPVCVPVIRELGAPLEFHLWTPDTPMVEGRFKALIPARPAPVIPHALIVPLLAFDRRGYRLGYGGGFYDRTLAELRATGPVLAVGLAYAGQEIAELPAGSMDQRLDAIVTPDGVITPA